LKAEILGNLFAWAALNIKVFIKAWKLLGQSHILGEEKIIGESLV
jgi:hypothetical protein